MVTRTKPPVSAVRNKEKVAPPTILLPKQILWRKIGGGSYTHCTGEKFRRGQTFKASVDQIPKAFRDTVVPVDPTALSNIVEEPFEVSEPKFSIVEKEDAEGNLTGYFEVMDGMGKVVSEGDLTDDEAEELVKSLKG